MNKEEMAIRSCGCCVFECDIDGWNSRCNIELCTRDESIYYKRNYRPHKHEKDNQKEIDAMYPCNYHRTPGEILKLLEHNIEE